MTRAPKSRFEIAQLAMDEGRAEDALTALNACDPTQRDVALLKYDAYMRSGELSRALGVLNTIRIVHADSELDQRARHLVGKLIETDPEWIPTIRPEPSEKPVGKRVLHILKESLPYVESGFTLRSAMSLRAQAWAGFEPVVVTSLGFPGTKGIGNFPTIEEIQGVPHHRLDADAEWVSRLPFDQQTQETAVRTAAVAGDWAPAIIQAASGYRGFDAALAALAVARHRDIPFIYEVRGFLEHTWTSELHRATSGEYYHRRRSQEDRCMRGASAVITIADAMRSEMVRRGIPEDRIHVVPNTVDTNRFRPRRPREELAERLGLEGRFVLGYVSNLGKREGVVDLIRAVSLLRTRGHDVACLIVGDGPEMPRLLRWRQLLSLEDFVVFTGRVPNAEIEDHYALIDLFVVPRIDDYASRFVTPLKPLEAMAMGLPVIASDLPALRELVSPDQRGRAFRPGDPVDLADVAEGLIRDPLARAQLSEAAMTWVRRERTVESNVIRYSRVLETLIG